MRVTPKNWSDFQHYRDRRPPWIKLHRALLDDRAFNALPLASKALAPFLWLLASEGDGGEFDGDPVELAFRLRWRVADVTSGLTHLIRSGVFIVVQDASAPLADRLQGATPETEGETEGETETLPGKPGGASKPAVDPDFEIFWKRYQPPKNAKKPDARKAWDATDGKRPPLADLLRAVDAYRSWLADESRKQKREYPMQHPSTWLRGEVWANYLAQEGSPVDEAAALAAWGGRAAPLVAEIGAVKFTSWFTDAQFVEPSPRVVQITVRKPFQRNWIANNYGSVLNRIYGQCEVKVAA